MDWLDYAKVGGPGVVALVIVGKGLQWLIDLILGEAKEALENAKKEIKQLREDNEELQEENDGLKDDVRDLRAKLQIARRP